ncbi:MAG: recombinase family protein [Actinomycetota bacterium]|nr:recombinase family protein [Actinomycetota bacterium]
MLVRQAAERVLAGHAVMTIAKDWNRRGVPGATEHPWTAKTLRKVLLSARIAGLREYGIDRSGKVLGALSPAVWEGAIDRKTWDHVRAVLLNPERLTTAGTPTRYLLTGLIFCDVCGRRMQARRRDARTERYVCAGQRTGHQLAILAQPVDDLVAARALELLTTPAVRQALVAQSGWRASGSLGQALVELGSAQARLETLDDDYYVRGALSVRRYRSIRTRLEREVDRLHGIVDRASKQRMILRPDPRQLWAEADFRQRRELLRLIVERVDVMPARRAARFDPSRLRLEIPLLAAPAEH